MVDSQELYIGLATTGTHETAITIFSYNFDSQLLIGIKRPFLYFFLPTRPVLDSIIHITSYTL